MIYIDTGAFLSRYVANDQYHHRAVKAWKRIARERTRCFTSNFVLDETLTLLARRAGYAFAAERAGIFYDSAVLTILRPDRDDEISALEYFQKYADQKVSFTDAVSFVLMRKAKLKRVFSYDRHFQHAGFKVWPTSL